MSATTAANRTITITTGRSLWCGEVSHRELGQRCTLTMPPGKRLLSCEDSTHVHQRHHLSGVSEYYITPVPSEWHCVPVGSHCVSASLLHRPTEHRRQSGSPSHTATSAAERERERATSLQGGTWCQPQWGERQQSTRLWSTRCSPFSARESLLQCIPGTA